MKWQEPLWGAELIQLFVYVESNGEEETAKPPIFNYNQLGAINSRGCIKPPDTRSLGHFIWHFVNGLILLFVFLQCKQRAKANKLLMSDNFVKKKAEKNPIVYAIQNVKAIPWKVPNGLYWEAVWMISQANGELCLGAVKVWYAGHKEHNLVTTGCPWLPSALIQAAECVFSLDQRQLVQRNLGGWDCS